MHGPPNSIMFVTFLYSNLHLIPGDPPRGDQLEDSACSAGGTDVEEENTLPIDEKEDRGASSSEVGLSGPILCLDYKITFPPCTVS